MLSLNRTPPPATLEDQFHGAHALSEYALREFEATALDLEAAAAQHACVCADAYAESDRLRELGNAAADAADQAAARARRIRELVAA